MKAMILSGGRGKRLRPVTDTIPKPLIKINGKPLIEWKINYLKKFGIKDIIICSGYKGKKIENYIKKKKNFGCNIEYSVETSPLGTGGAIKKAIKNIVDDSFIVLNGDIITNINLKKMMVKTNSIAAIELRTNYGTMKIKNNKILQFNEKTDVKDILGEPYIRSEDNNISSKSGLGLGTFIGKTLLERMKANVTFDKCPKTHGAMVTIQWQTNSLLSI